MKPQYKHDCDNCKFLGLMPGFDFYYCDQGAIPTVIARTGNEGPDYVSGMALTHYRPIKIAKLMAIEQGYIHEPCATLTGARKGNEVV